MGLEKKEKSMEQKKSKKISIFLLILVVLLSVLLILQVSGAWFTDNSSAQLNGGTLRFGKIGKLELVAKDVEWTDCNGNAITDRDCVMPGDKVVSASFSVSYVAKDDDKIEDVYYVIAKDDKYYYFDESQNLKEIIDFNASVMIEGTKFSIDSATAVVTVDGTNYTLDGSESSKNIPNSAQGQEIVMALTNANYTVSIIQKANLTPSKAYELLTNQVVSWVAVEQTPQDGILGVGGQTYNTGTHLVIDVQAGQTYKINGWTSTSPEIYPLAFVKDSDGKVIQTFGLTSGNHLNEIISIPANGVQLIINGTSKDNPGYASAYLKSFQTQLTTCGLFLGDSIIQGVGVLPQNDSLATPSLDAVSVASKTLNKNILNGGIGGSTYSQSASNFAMMVDSLVNANYTQLETYINSLEKQYPNEGFNGALTQYGKIKKQKILDLEFIAISFGTNDFASGSVVDNSSNLYDKTTILGSLRYGIKVIQENYPKIKIFVFTPIYREKLGPNSNQNSDSYVNSQGITLVQLGEKIKNLCLGLNNVYCKNMYSVITSSTASSYIKDGTHCNQAGYNLLGKEFAKFISANL